MEPPIKRARCNDVDLKITVGGGGETAADGTDNPTVNNSRRQQVRDDELPWDIDIGEDVSSFPEDSDGEEDSDDEDAAAAAAAAPTDSKIYWYNSAIMATHSKYIEAMLSAPMRESANLELKFPEITPPTWELMMNFVEDLSAARKMCSLDVLKVVEYYDKYDFVQGRKLCDDVLSDSIKRAVNAEKKCNTFPRHAGKFVDILVAADKYNLTKARELGMDHLAQKLSSKSSLYGRTMFKIRHMEKLVPILAREAERDPKPSYLEGDTVEAILSPSFPELYVLRAQAFAMKRNIQSSIQGISVQLALTDGRTFLRFLYKKVENRQYNGNCIFRNTAVPSCSMRVKKGAWVIVHRVQQRNFLPATVEKLLYRFPCGNNLPLPSENVNWIRVDTTQPAGTLTIKHLYNVPEADNAPAGTGAAAAAP